MWLRSCVRGIAFGWSNVWVWHWFVFKQRTADVNVGIFNIWGQQLSSPFPLADLPWQPAFVLSWWVRIITAAGVSPFCQAENTRFTLFLHAAHHCQVTRTAIASVTFHYSRLQFNYGCWCFCSHDRSNCFLRTPDGILGGTKPLRQLQSCTGNRNWFTKVFPFDRSGGGGSSPEDSCGGGVKCREQMIRALVCASSVGRSVD